MLTTLKMRKDVSVRWYNVEYVKHTQSTVTVKCKVCGHVWKTSSLAAFRLIPKNQ
jgi:uncharacterized Zn finger protein